jgi:hypothetical protein
LNKLKTGIIREQVFPDDEIAKTLDTENNFFDYYEFN